MTTGTSQNYLIPLVQRHSLVLSSTQEYLLVPGMTPGWARAGLAWMQPNFKVLRKVSNCDDDRHFSKLFNSIGPKALTSTQ